MTVSHFLFPISQNPKYLRPMMKKPLIIILVQLFADVDVAQIIWDF